MLLYVFALMCCYVQVYLRTDVLLRTSVPSHQCAAAYECAFALMCCCVKVYLRTDVLWHTSVILQLCWFHLWFLSVIVNISD